MKLSRILLAADVGVWRTLNEDRDNNCLLGVFPQKNGRISSRLDFWLISLHLIFNVESPVTEPSS